MAAHAPVNAQRRLIRRDAFDRYVHTLRVIADLADEHGSPVAIFAHELRDLVADGNTMANYSVRTIRRQLGALDAAGWIKWSPSRSAGGTHQSTISFDPDRRVGGLRIRDWFHVLDGFLAESALLTVRLQDHDRQAEIAAQVAECCPASGPTDPP